MPDANGTLDGLTTKAKIGLVVVSASTVSELRYPKAVPEVGFFASRMMLGGDHGLEALLEMEQNSSRSVQELASAGVDSIAYCCTVSGAQRGLAKDREFCEEMERQWGAPTTSTMLAAAEALQHLGIRRVVLTKPLPAQLSRGRKPLPGRSGHRDGLLVRDGVPGSRRVCCRPAQRDIPLLTGGMAAERRRGRRAVRKLHELRRNGRSPSTGGRHRQACGDLAFGHAVAGALALAGVAEPVRGYGRLLAETGERRTPAAV